MNVASEVLSFCVMCGADTVTEVTSLCFNVNSPIGKFYNGVYLHPFFFHYYMFIGNGNHMILTLILL